MSQPGFDLTIAKRILRVSIPLMGSMVGNLLMMLVDRICLARYSNDTLAASGPAIYTSMAIVGFFCAAVGFSRSCVAQAFGRSGHAEASRQGAIGLLIGIALAAIQALLAPLIAQIPFLSSRPPDITRLESQFLYLSSYFGAVMTLNMALSSYFNGIGKTRITLVSGLVGQAVGIVATIGLVFGKFGMPELGMRGSPLGTLLGTLAILLCYLAYMPAVVWRDVGNLLFKRALKLTDVTMRIRKGFTIGISTGLGNLGNTVFIWIIAGLGPIALSANNVNLTVNYIGIIPLIGLAIGCSVLCGNAIGEGDYPQIPRILWVTLAIELAYVVLISFFQIATPEWLLSPFGLSGKPEEIRQASTATSRVLWVYSLAFAFSITGSSVLEAFGMTRFLFVVRLILMWGLSIPAIYIIAARHVGQPEFLPTCWIVGSAFEAVIGLLYFWRIWQAVKHRQNEVALAGVGG
jgi:MATE family multidrug resistance protein